MENNRKKKAIIAIDGYSACGKSTLAKQLANALQYTFIDTGAMYRAITLFFLRKKVLFDDESDIHKALQKIKLSFIWDQQKQVSEIFLNGENVENEIRLLPVSDSVSEVAAIKAVREAAVKQQREMGKKGGVVMDGRDIGTAVFPNADLKIFMTADKSVRAQRRFRELTGSHPEITLAEVKANLDKRDEIDRNRKESPLRQADDARVLDNSDLTRQQQLHLVLKWVSELKIN